MCIRDRYLSAKQVRDKITTIIEENTSNIPILIYDQLEDKIFTRANKIASKLNVDPKGKTYITEPQFDLIASEIIRSYEFAQIDPGAAVGMVAAQSIGEPGTQMTL